MNCLPLHDTFLSFWRDLYTFEEKLEVPRDLNAEVLLQSDNGEQISLCGDLRDLVSHLLN